MCATVPHFSPLRNTFDPFFPTSWGTTPPHASGRSGRVGDDRGSRPAEGRRGGAGTTGGARRRRGEAAAGTAPRHGRGGGGRVGTAWGGRPAAGGGARSGYCLGTTILWPTTSVLPVEVGIQRLELGGRGVEAVGDARQRVAGLDHVLLGDGDRGLGGLDGRGGRGWAEPLMTPELTTMPMRAMTATRNTTGAAMRATVRGVPEPAGRARAGPRRALGRAARRALRAARPGGALNESTTGAGGSGSGSANGRRPAGRRCRPHGFEAPQGGVGVARSAGGAGSAAGGAPSADAAARAASPLLWCLVGHRLSWRSLRIDSAAAAAALR